MGTSWISRKEGILEKGGMTPLTNYEYDWLHSNFYITITDYKYTVTNNLDQIQSLIYRLLYNTQLPGAEFSENMPTHKMFCLNTGL